MLNRAALEERARAHTSPFAEVARAKIVPLAATGSRTPAPTRPSGAAASTPTGPPEPPAPAPELGDDEPMPAPPASTNSSLASRLTDHARQRWPQLAIVQVRFRAGFVYVDGDLDDGDPLPLCRLRYGGSASRWRFAIYRASHDDYHDSILPSRRVRPNTRGSPRQRLRALPQRSHLITDELTGRTTCAGCPHPATAEPGIDRRTTSALREGRDGSRDVADHREPRAGELTVQG